MYTKHKFESDRYFNFNYALYLPKDFDESKKYPLVLFLHGAGERGDDLDIGCRHGYMKHVRESGAEYPFIIVAPQIPYSIIWGSCIESLLGFLDYICETLPVDKERVYATGFSMGGMGTWLVAMTDPDRFAAIAPICAPGFSWNAACLKNTPVFMYHGEFDEIISVENSRDMLNAVNGNGGNAKLIVCPVGHNAWDYAYAGDELYTWLLSHKKDKK